MGEPVTTGMMIGAALGGGTSAIRGDNPLKGALMGGALGAAGGSGLMGDIGSLNKFMNANPTTSQMGMGLAKNLMAEDQSMPYAPQGQIRQGQVQPMDYMSLLNPQNQTVIRPPQISLLG